MGATSCVARGGMLCHKLTPVWKRTEGERKPTGWLDVETGLGALAKSMTLACKSGAGWLKLYLSKPAPQ